MNLLYYMRSFFFFWVGRTKQKYKKGADGESQYQELKDRTK